MTTVTRKQDWRKVLTRRTDYNPEFGLSGTWRIRKSLVPEVEFKYILEAVQSFIDVLTAGTKQSYRVLWKGQEDLPAFTAVDRPVITLTYGPIEDALSMCPVDAEIVDIVTGLAIHEAGHAVLGKIRGPNDYKGLINNILEDAYIDMGTVKDHPVLGAYINRMRKYYRSPDIDGFMKRRFEDPRRFKRHELIAAWQAFVLEECDIVMGMENGNVVGGALGRVQSQLSDDANPLLDALQGLLKITVKGSTDLGNDLKTYRAVVTGATRVIDQYEKEINSLPAPTPQAPPQSNPSNTLGSPPQPSAGSASGKGDPDDEDDEAPQELSGNASDQLPDDAPRSAGRQDEGEDEDDEEGAGAGEDDDEDIDDEDWDEIKGDGQTAADGPTQDQQDDEEDGEEGHGGHQPEEAHSHLPTDSGGHGDAPDEEIEIHPTTCLDELMQGMPPELAEKTFEMMEHEAEDVSDIAGEKFIMKKPFSAAPVPTNDRITEDIRQAFETRRHIATTDIPFQDNGRICRRTLPRWFMGKEDLFEVTEIEDEIDVALGLLVDCSSSISVRGKWGEDNKYTFDGKGQWEIIMETCQVMVDAFEENQLDLYVMAYSTGLIWRLYEPEFERLHLGQVHPQGGTPSIPAMKVMADKMIKEAGHREDKIIIHMTDGMPNQGGSNGNMPDCVRRIEEQGIKVIGIGIGVPPEALEKQYSRSFSVQDVTDVPAQLRKIVEAL